MHFSRTRPAGEISAVVEWYWTMESDDRKPIQKKIVPDGFPELVYHYGDPYRIRLGGRWSRQSRAVLAGQLENFCFIENTGRSGIFGITFKPAALTHLFNLSMKDYCGRAVNLDRVPGPWASLMAALKSCDTPEERMVATDRFLKPYLPSDIGSDPIERCLGCMTSGHGTLSIAEVCDAGSVTERQLQRLFSRYIGLSPKFYARILRFSHIFSLIKEGQISWADVVYLSGYYDQSHFIRDFKRFTGEDPTSFSFREKSLTTFFTQKSGQQRMSGLSKSR